MKALVIICSICAIVFYSACKKSSSGTGGNNNGGSGTTFTPNCTGAAIQFSADVAPIISSSCATNSGCHAAGSTQGPGGLTTYAQINAVKVQIRAAIISGAMPKNGTLTAAQKNSIICWIDAGAPNN
ncbi:hypothetical protein ESA94_12325 [Lacibacter luteus]|uniref:Cytochrome c domain-containing protein n=1 Tax=Lacibacter luteus TaxID=2508719 RepID=A0A4Q1CI88_9BACT|nr:hypothetical protein [Lacibacter luteus]RXK59835.1 hypothetical protein ESA94_12325 [Lacibacter luteus]